MIRLKRFDYKSPYFYMVTLKRLKGLEAFSQIGPKGLVENDLTKAFAKAIKGFHLKWRCLDEISPFAIMPDHIHLMMKIKPTPDRVALGVLVSQLSKALRAAYWETVGETADTQNPVAGLSNSAGAALSNSAGAGSANCASAGSANCASAQCRAKPRDIFAPAWHDWIVKREGQLAAFRRYIRENPARAWARKANARFFQRVEAVEFLGRRWFAYGNPAILRMPVITPFKGHRATAQDSDAWNAAIEAAARIGPGGAGLSTFMSPLEKACGNAIAKTGGKLIVLSPEGFSPRWHPTRDKERFCAQGRMLFRSLYEASTRQPTRKELYERCHEMIDLAITTLPGIEA